MAGDELNELLSDLPSDVRRALSHPYRRQILRILLVGGPMSSVEIADHPSAPCSAPCLSRHVRVLSVSSLLTEESVREERGMTEHFFSAAPLPDSIHEALAETDALDRGTGLVRP
ncbi:MAG TPA: helix-turn-helix domain-containing protein [Solirubrobacterales bacterium]|nr:helix-turn-helix domain-containing protein [Solirubrobacterales bacterium]